MSICLTRRIMSVSSKELTFFGVFGIECALSVKFSYLLGFSYIVLQMLAGSDRTCALCCRDLDRMFPECVAV